MPEKTKSPGQQAEVPAVLGGSSDRVTKSPVGLYLVVWQSRRPSVLAMPGKSCRNDFHHRFVAVQTSFELSAVLDFAIKLFADELP